MTAGKGGFGTTALVLMVALLVGYEAALPGGAAQTEALVHAVTDGDTVVLEGGRRVRYLGIDAPEVAHEGKPGDPFVLCGARGRIPYASGLP